MLTKLGTSVRRWVIRQQPWTEMYGVARSILAMATALTLTFNPSHILFRPAAGIPAAPHCGGLARLSLFCFFPSGQLEVARWVAVVILLVAASGYRPRLTGLFHWWIAFSLQASAITVDGGDQINAVLALLLLPVTLTDSRRWHWQRPSGEPTPHHDLRALLALSALVMIRLQVAGVYFHSSIGKFGVREWADGTALYYWFTNPSYGASEWLLAPLMPLIRNGLVVALLTWGTMILEVFLFMALVMPKRTWKVFWVLGILLHASIAVVHGLVSFSLEMMAALTLYLRLPEEQLVPGWILSRFKLGRKDSRKRLPATTEPVGALS